MKIISVTCALVLVLCFVGCGSSGPVAGPNPLVAQYTVAASAGSTVAVEFGPDSSYGFTTSAKTVPDGATSVTLQVAGMKQGSTYHMRAVTTHPDNSQTFDDDRLFTTGSAPSGRIPNTTVTNPSGTPSPGVELLSLNPGVGTSTNDLMVVALDTAGNLIWYYDYDATLGLAQPVKLLPNGDFLLVLFAGGSGPGGIVREVDLSGTTVHEFSVSDLNQWLSAAGYSWTVNAIHHDITVLPNGHFLVLVNSVESNLPGYPGIPVLGDGIVDLDQNYKPVWTWSSFDHLLVNRHPMSWPDWTHTNTILYSPDDGNILLSMRHQSWVIKIDYANGQGAGDVLWRLGYQGDFTLLNSTSPADWFFAQHFANIISPNSTGDFQLALFDNGDNRVLDLSGTTCGSTGAPACYSRPAYFDVNENALTAQLLWSDVVPYSFWGGAIMRMPNSNMFFDITTFNTSGSESMEVTQATPPQVVWQLDVQNQNSYRTIHMPSLYPGVQW